jgi:hypothetical protein
MTVFSDLVSLQWPVILDSLGITGTLTDATGVDYPISGVFTPRMGRAMLDDTWQEQAKQAEFYAVLPTGFVFVSGECTATIGGVEYTIMETGISDGNNTRLLLDRRDLSAVSLRGRRI